MARIFCIANQKGGVGKTTTTVNLAAGLARLGQRVLVVDLDPQGNATMGSGVDKRALELSVYDVLLESASVAEARRRSEKTGYDVLGANRELAGAEVELVELERRDKRLKTALAAVDAEYDFVLVDCPPSLSLLTLNGLCAAHGVVVPMQCEYFALEGLSDLVNTIKQVHANLNPDLQIIGLLRVMFDPRITLQQQVSEQLKAHLHLPQRRLRAGPGARAQGQRAARLVISFDLLRKGRLAPLFSWPFHVRQGKIIRFGRRGVPETRPGRMQCPRRSCTSWAPAPSASPSSVSSPTSRRSWASTR